MSKEIERKFLLNSLPSFPFLSEYVIYQSYISINPEVRVRKCQSAFPAYGSSYTMTIKSNGTLSRDELETNITDKFYNECLKFIGRDPIRKQCYIYKFDGYKIEVSIVDGKFVYAEVEFNSIEKSESFNWPWRDCLLKEITYDHEYKMKNYWINSRLPF